MALVRPAKKIPYAVIYTRVSTQSQTTTDSYTLDVQRIKCTEWAEANGYTVKAICTDEGISGAILTKRPGVQRAIKLLGKGDVLVVHSVSRLSRDVRDTLNLRDEIKRRGAKLHSLSEIYAGGDAPMDEAVLTISATFAQLERKQTGVKIKQSLERRRELGKLVGRPPYGMRASGGVNSPLVECKEEQEIIRLMMDIRNTLTEGGHRQSYAFITNFLNQEGVTPPKNARIWYERTVTKIIQKEEEEISFDRLKGRFNRFLCEEELEEVPSLVASPSATSSIYSEGTEEDFSDEEEDAEQERLLRELEAELEKKKAREAAAALSEKEQRAEERRKKRQERELQIKRLQLELEGAK